MFMEILSGVLPSFFRALLSNYTRLRNEGLESEALKPKFHRDWNWVAGGVLQAFVGGVIVMDIEVLQGFSRSFLHVLFMSLRVFWGLQSQPYPSGSKGPKY